MEIVISISKILSIVLSIVLCSFLFSLLIGKFISIGMGRDIMEEEFYKDKTNDTTQK